MDGRTVDKNIFYGTVKPSSLNTVLFPNKYLSKEDIDTFFVVDTGEYNGNWSIYPNYQTGYIDIFVEFLTSDIPEDHVMTFRYKEIFTPAPLNKDYNIINEVELIKYNIELKKDIYTVRSNIVSVNDYPVQFYNVIFTPSIGYSTFKDGKRFKLKLPFNLPSFGMDKKTLISTFPLIDNTRDIFIIDTSIVGCNMEVYELSNAMVTEEEYEARDKTIKHIEHLIYQGETTIDIDLGLLVTNLSAKHLSTGKTFILDYNNPNKNISIPSSFPMGMYEFTFLCLKPSTFRGIVPLVYDVNSEPTYDINISNIDILNKNRIFIVGDDSTMNTPFYMIPGNDSYDASIILYSSIDNSVHPLLVDRRKPIPKIDLEDRVGSSPIDWKYKPLNQDEYISISEELENDWKINKYGTPISDRYTDTIGEFVESNINIWSKIYLLDYPSLNKEVEYEIEYFYKNDLIIFKITLLNVNEKYQLYASIEDPAFSKSTILMEEISPGIFIPSKKAGKIDRIQYYNVFCIGMYSGFINVSPTDNPNINIDLGYYDNFFSIRGIPTTITKSFYDITDNGSYGYGNYGETPYGGDLDDAE